MENLFKILNIVPIEVISKGVALIPFTYVQLGCLNRLALNIYISTAEYILFWS